MNCLKDKMQLNKNTVKKILKLNNIKVHFIYQ